MEQIVMLGVKEHDHYFLVLTTKFCAYLPTKKKMKPYV